MALFKKKYKIIGEVSHRYKHSVSAEEAKKAKVCSNCGKTTKVKSYFCPICKCYYCIECSIQTIGGSVCPHCEGVNFLKTVSFK
jgi:hypothetical protein